MIKNIVEKYKAMTVQAKASMWFLVCSFIQKGIVVLTTPIFTRIMSTEEYGAYNVFNSWFGIIAIIVSLNLSQGVYTQGLIKYENDKKVFSSSIEGLSTLLIICWSVIYFAFSNIFNSLLRLNTIQMAAMLVMIWTGAVIGFWSCEQRVDYKYQKLVLMTLAVSIVQPVTGIWIVLNSSDKVTGRIVGIAGVEFVFYLGLFIYQVFRGRVLFYAKYWVHALKFNLPLVPHYLSFIVLSNSDRIMIERMIGESEAGIYSLAYSVASLMAIFHTALMGAISPWMYQKMKTDDIDDIKRIIYPSMGLMAGVNVLLMCLAPEVIQIFAPIAYYEAIWVVPPIAMSVFFIFLFDVFSKFEFFYEKTNYVMIASTGGASLNILLNYLFIPKFGYIAAGYTTLICDIILCICHFFFMGKICKTYYKGIFPFDNRVLLEISVIFVIIGILFLLLYNNVFIRYIVFIVGGIIAFIKRKAFIRMINNIISVNKVI